MQADIAVVGGGPAGAVVARLLAGRGYRVVLLARRSAYPALEGLAERAAQGLRHAGCFRALATAGPEAGRAVHWNGEHSAINRERLLERSAFDAALLADAREAGVTVLDTRAGRVRRTASGWRIALADAELKSGFLIEARGRVAPRARIPVRRGPATLALSRRWRMPCPGTAGTRIASSADGWLWFATDGGDTTLAQVFVDRDTLPARAALTGFYHDRLAAFPAIRNLLRDAQALGSVHVRNAHTQCAGRLIEPAYARAGDAAFAIDPLSGHGLYQAIGGALALAAAVHTLLARPGDTPAALRFYRERIEAEFLRMARIGRDVYHREQRWPDRPFWRSRQSWPDAEPAHAPPGAAPPRIERRPVNDDGFIAEREVIVTPDHPRGLWQVAGVELVPLLRWLDGQPHRPPSSLEQHYAAYCDQPPAACRAALAWLQARGLPADANPHRSGGNN